MGTYGACYTNLPSETFWWVKGQSTLELEALGYLFSEAVERMATTNDGPKYIFRSVLNQVAHTKV